MVLPLFVVYLISASLALMGLSFLSFIIPMIIGFTWVVLFLISAYFTRNIELFKGKNYTFTLGSIFGIFALGLFITLFLGIDIRGLFSSVVYLVPSSVTRSNLDFVKDTGIQPISFMNFLIIIIFTTVVYVVLKKYFVKR